MRTTLGPRGKIVKKQDQQTAIDNYYDALIALTAVAQDSLEVHEAIFVGMRFYGKLAFDCAPSVAIAHKTINAGIECAFEEYEERLELENDKPEFLTANPTH